MDWDIRPEGVQKVLTDTQTAATQFDPLAKQYSDNIRNAMVGTNDLMFGVIAVAIGEYSEHWGPSLESAAKQVGASITGAYNATKAYIDGQNEMVLNAQREAAAGYTPPQPGDPDYGSGGAKAI
ncbi:DUF6507 family protein [Kribbella sp. NBC_01505]|uniref:DUF6507 family protein n=1 Tax=Kribbella sp. NBC_01505 TaxID=2903580 RepID=UPI003869C7F9